MNSKIQGARYELSSVPTARKCCWNCRFYTRPPSWIGIDVPLGSICSVDWHRSLYRPNDGLAPGEKYMNAHDSCDKFEALTQN